MLLRMTVFRAKVIITHVGVSSVVLCLFAERKLMVDWTDTRPINSRLDLCSVVSFYLLTHPPSTISVWPVHNEDAS
jgi:hypothetical protein